MASAMTTELTVTKIHGCANDYLFVNCLDTPLAEASEVARKLSDRRRGIGSDSLICIYPSEDADFRMEMYNADGSRGAMCGNGIRGLSKYVADRGLATGDSLEVASGGVLATERDNWSLYYNFYQFIHVESDDPTQGWGIFGRIGFADKITSPIQRFYNFGFGGKGIIPGRDDDTFGAGFYYADDSDELSPIYSNFLELDAGYGFELFYNVQVTPWFHLTPDIQVIEPASGSLDTVVVVGLRSKIEF